MERTRIERPNVQSICLGCNSRSYCANFSKWMMACIDYNRFPKPEKDEWRDR